MNEIVHTLTQRYIMILMKVVPHIHNNTWILMNEITHTQSNILISVKDVPNIQQHTDPEDSECRIFLHSFDQALRTGIS